MNVDRILTAMNENCVDYLLIGGMNFLLRHEPVVTFDVDLWIDDTDENRHRAEQALARLDAEWGVSDDNWESVAKKSAGWLARQGIICLTSPHGAIDIFRSVRGLDSWHACAARAMPEATSSGIQYRGLSDIDMLECQLALDHEQQKHDRVARLRGAVETEATND